MKKARKKKANSNNEQKISPTRARATQAIMESAGRTRTPQSFVSLLLRHKAKIGFPWDALADRSGIHESQFSNWVTRRDRIANRESVSKVAYGLATLYEEFWRFKAEREQKVREGENASDLHAGPEEYWRFRAELERRVQQGSALRDLYDGSKKRTWDPQPTEVKSQRTGNGRKLDETLQGEEELNYRGIGDLEHILAGLLESVGYMPNVPGADLIWHRLAGKSDREVRVGWYKAYPLAHSEGNEDEPTEGIAKLVTEQLARLVGWRVKWRQIAVGSITPELLRGEIDMICCQYISLVPRNFDVWMSHPLPRLRIYPAVVVHKDYRETIVPGGNEVNFEMLYPVHTRTKIGDSLCSFVTHLPGTGKEKFETIRLEAMRREQLENKAGSEEKVGENLVKDDQEDDYRVARNGSIMQLAKFVTEKPVGPGGKVRCLFTDAFSAVRASKTIPGACMVKLPDAESLPYFGIGFALHPREGGKLGELLNRSIDKLRELDYFQRVAYKSYEPFLREANALPSRELSDLREAISDVRKKLLEEWGDPNE